MSREIEFKCWLSSINKMTHALDIQGWAKCAPFGCEPIWLQYTGLKDKNGKQIFEGDIMTSSTEDRLKVVFENGGFCFSNDLLSGSDRLHSIRVSRLEIIGNIYENPELLT